MMVLPRKLEAVHMIRPKVMSAAILVIYLSASRPRGRQAARYPFQPSSMDGG
jgi:hypothetical protein